MKVHIEYTAQDLKELVLADLNKKMDMNFTLANIAIETKSKQNYKSEWEQADFRATYQETK